MARRRTGLQVIEDAFFDLPAADQKQLLGTLATLHRLKTRQDQSKATKKTGESLLDGQPAEA